MRNPVIKIFAFLILLFTGLLFCSMLNAQQLKVDSLLKALKLSPDDTNKVNLLNKLYTEYQSIVPSKALKYAKQALELSEKLGFQRGSASSYNNIGRAHFQNGKSNDALDNYLKALEIFNEQQYE